MTTILLTGYAPFATFQRNPSFEGLRRAAERGLFDELSARVEIAELPVAYEEAAARFLELVQRLQPDAAVSFGVHFGRHTRYRDGVIYPERVARNRDGNAENTRPDNQGVIRTGQPIVADAPSEIPASFPADELVQRLRAAGFASMPSDNAGDYLCNHIFFAGMHHYGAQRPYGFVHVPPTTDVGGTITVDELAAAQTLIARVVVEQLAARTTA